MLGRWLAQSAGGQKRLLNWGQGCANMGYLRLAEWAYKQVVVHGSPDPVAYFALGKTQNELGRLGEAKSTLRQGLNLHPNFYLCKHLLFDSCRDEYWHAHNRLEMGDATVAPPTTTDENALAGLHARVKAALFTDLRYEIGRLDMEEHELEAIRRFEAKLQLNAQTKKYRELDQSLAKSKALLDDISVSLESSSFSPAHRAGGLTRVELRSGQHRRLRGVHDADDLIGYHLEVVLDDQLTFISFEVLKAIEFHEVSDYTAVELYFTDGHQRQAVMPTTYHLTQYCDHDAVREGEMTALQPLHKGMHVGLGKRVLIGHCPLSDEKLSLRFDDIKRLELNVDRSAMSG